MRFQAEWGGCLKGIVKAKNGIALIFLGGKIFSQHHCGKSGTNVALLLMLYTLCCQPPLDVGKSIRVIHLCTQQL